MKTDDVATNFIRVKHIDSFHKLHFLLFLHQHPHIQGTTQQFAERLYIGDTSLLAKFMTELQNVGLLDCIESCYQLRDELEIRSSLQSLASAFEDPLSRQNILDQVIETAPLAV